MPKGGARIGCGPKKGTKYRPRLKLSAEQGGGDRKPTAADRMRALRRQVILCVADGMTQDSIAAVVGVPIDKLVALFGHELRHGREIVRAEQLLRLDTASDDGSVPASKAILATSGGPNGGPAANPQSSKPASGGDLNQRALRLINGAVP